MATQSEIAEHLDLSQQAVSQMIADGVLPTAQARRGLDVKACRIAYVRHLRERAAGRTSDAAAGEGLDLVAERARLAKSQADAQEMRNDVMRGQVVLVSEVAAGVTVVCAAVRNRLLALPSEKAPAIYRCRTAAEVQGVLYAAIHEALTELSSPGALFDAKPSLARRKETVRRLQSGE